MRRHSTTRALSHPEFRDTAPELGVLRIPLRLRRPGHRPDHLIRSGIPAG